MVLVEKLKITDHYKEQNRKNHWVVIYALIQNVVLYIDFYVILYPEFFSHYNFFQE